jgi:hypothetical protein
MRLPFSLPAAIGLAGLLWALPASGQSLIHQYSFNSNANDSVGSANGALLNGATVSGGVLNLDGVNDMVQFASHIVPTSGAFSVAFFAQQVGGLQGNFIEWISQGSSGGPGFYVGYQPGGSPIRVTDIFPNTGVAYPGDGAVHHVAVTTDGSTSTLYLNGLFAASLAGGLNTTAGGSDTAFGAQFGGFGEYFRGTLDDVRIYTGTLSATQVFALANPEATTPEPGALTLGAGVVLTPLVLRRKKR